MGMGARRWEKVIVDDRGRKKNRRAQRLRGESAEERRYRRN